MKQFIERIGLLFGSFGAVAVLATVPVAAQHGSDHTTNAADTTVSISSTTSSESDHQAAHTESEAAASNTHDGTKLLQTVRQHGKQHSTADRQTSCKAHEVEINKRADNYAGAAQRHLATFNTIFTKVQAFHDNKKLVVANYDTLIAAAKTKQTAAQSAVDALKAVDVKIDCTQTDPANSVATLKTAVKNARTALQEYRASIKDIVVALKGASNANQGAHDTNTSTTPTTSTGEKQ